jgi:hypothetical protein
VTIGAPQLAQNLRPSRLSLPHFEQRILASQGRLSAQLIEQYPGVFEVGGVETFGEPVVDLSKHGARFIETAFSAE